MHDTAYQIGRLFFESYFDGQAPSVLDVGSRDINGTLRACAPPGTKYVGVDLESGAGVDVVLKDPNKLPFEPNSFDATVSSSCFEHDQMFWLTFLEMARVTKHGGFIYINAPSNGFYHSYPYDNWRFYPDSGLALTEWAKTAGLRLQLIESFVARRVADYWNDCVLVFRKGTKRTVLPPKLLCDLVPAPFNVRRYPKLDIENLRAETEDMILLQEAKDHRVAEEATAQHLLAEVGKVQGSLASSHDLLESLSAAFCAEKESVAENLKELREEALRNRGEIDRLKAEIERIRDEADRETRVLSVSLEEQRRTFAAMTQVLVDQLKAASAEKESIAEHVKELHDEAARSRGELDRLRAEAAAEQSRTAAEVAAERAEQRQLVEALKLELERIRVEADSAVDRTRREAETNLDEQQRVRQHLEAHIGQLQHELAATREDARKFSEALETQLRQIRNDAAEGIAERDRCIDLLNANYARVMNSDSWRVTLLLRKAGALLPPKARARVRWIPKSVYWLLTPHKIPARLRFIRERQARLRLVPAPANEVQAPVVVAPTVAIDRTELHLK